MQNDLTIKKSITIHSDVGTVYKTWVNLDEWPLWTPTIAKIKRLNNIPFDVGTRVKIYQPDLAPAIWKIVSVHQGHSFEWVKKTSGLKISALHLVEPARDNCRVTVELNYSGLFSRLAYHFTNAIVNQYLEAELKSLKSFCEQEQRGISNQIINLNFYDANH